MKQFLPLLIFLFFIHPIVAQVKTCSQQQRMEQLRMAKDELRTSEEYGYDVTFYFLDLSVTNKSTFVEGKVTIKAIAERDALAEVFLDLSSPLLVEKVLDNGAELSFNHNGDELIIDLPSPLSEGSAFELEIQYSGVGSEGIFHAFSDTWGNEVTYTLSEPLSAKGWFPCKQDLLDKADSADIFITVDENLGVGSNGLLTDTTRIDANRVRYEWKTRYPIAYYLLSFVTTTYVEYNTYAKMSESDSILIQNFIYDNPNTLSTYQADLDEIDEMMALFSELYGAYPFRDEKYGHAMAPFSGGMEHQTMSTMGLFTFELDAHELAHQWFGNNVTCGTWQDIWINEGFARYSEYIALEFLRSKAEANIFMQNNMNRVLDRRATGSVFVPEEFDENPSRIFDFDLSYNKGSILVHMIRYLVDDDDMFFEILRDFQQDFADGVATGADVKDYLNAKTGKSFDSFFDQYYFGEGYPIYSIGWNYVNDTLYIDYKQEASAPLVTPFFDIPLEFGFINANNEDVLITLEATQSDSLYKIPMMDSLISVRADPDLWVLKKVERLTRDVKLGSPDAIITGFNNSLDRISIFPNPVKNDLHIEGIAGNAALFQVNGQTVKAFDIAPKGSKIPMNTFKPGIYLLNVTSRSGTKVYRIVKL